MVTAQLNEVQGHAYLSKRIEETGQEFAIYDMVVGDIKYSFPSNYSTSDKAASVMMSSELVLETKTLTYGPGGVIILEEPPDPELYAYLLDLFAGRPDNGTDTEDMVDQQELDSFVTRILDELNLISAKL